MDERGLEDLISSGGIVGSPDAPPPICEILVPHVCNGMGESYPYGDYVKVHVGIEREQKWLRLRMSKGAAQLLVAELQGILGPDTQ